MVKIGQREIGPEAPVYVVAELSGNHLHDWQRCARLVEAARAAGADAVKGQCFTPQGMTLDMADEAHMLTWAGQRRTLFDLYAETAMPLEWHARLLALCHDLGMDYFASVFCGADVDLMVGLGAPCLKIASFEVTDIPLIRYAASKHLPLLISCGMATLDEVWQAWYAADYDTILLKCTSAYPAPAEDANLLALQEFPEYVGLSDHSRSNAVVSAAVALGACLVERHLTLSREDGGPDAAFSDEPHEFAEMVRCIRQTSAVLGSGQMGPAASEAANLRFRRSLWVTRDIAEGEAFTLANVASLRPAGGLPPGELYRVLTLRADRAYRRGEALVL